MSSKKIEGRPPPVATKSVVVTPPLEARPTGPRLPDALVDYAVLVGKIDAAVKGFTPAPPATAWTAVGVIQDSLQAVRYYIGKKPAGDGQPDPKTIFYMGSVTKTFTAALLARTIERTAGDNYHPITLNTLMIDLTGSLPPEVYNGGSSWPGTLTLGELARHDAGLPRNGASSPRSGGDPAKWTYVRLFKDLFELRERDPSIDYSNFGYQLLGWALALKWGDAWETLLATEITTPLGMNETKVFEDLSPSQKKRIAPPDVKHYPIPPKNKLAGEANAYNTTDPSGYLVTTGPDMMKWLAFNLGLAGSPRDSLLGILFTPGASQTSLGWKTQGSGASLTFSKSGAVGDYRAEIRFSPTSPKGVFVMTNNPFETVDLQDKVWSDVF